MPSDDRRAAVLGGLKKIGQLVAGFFRTLALYGAHSPASQHCTGAVNCARADGGAAQSALALLLRRAAAAGALRWTSLRPADIDTPCSAASTIGPWRSPRAPTPHGRWPACRSRKVRSSRSRPT